MKSIISILILSFSVLLFSACKSDTNEETNSTTNQLDSLPPKGTLNSTNEYDENMEVVFQENKKDTPVEDSILKVLHLCDPSQKDLKNYLRPACDAKFFKFFPIKQNSNLKDNFLVLCKSGVAGFPMRRILVYSNVGGQYVLANTFLADLIGMEKNKHVAYKDLILQFMDEDENRFECRYVWREGRYSYQKVMKINRSPIKPQFLDSMKVVIGNEINRMKLSY